LLKWPSQPLYGSFIRYRVSELSSIQAFLAYESIIFVIDLMPKGPSPTSSAYGMSWNVAPP